MKKILVINLYSGPYTPTTYLKGKIQSFIKEKCGVQAIMLNEYKGPFEMSNALDKQKEGTIIITETPVLMNLVFNDKYDAESKYKIMLNHKKYDSINILVKMQRPLISLIDSYNKVESFNPDLDHALEIDDKIKKELTSNIDFEFIFTEKENILSEISTKIIQTFPKI